MTQAIDSKGTGQPSSGEPLQSKLSTLSVTCLMSHTGADCCSLLRVHTGNSAVTNSRKRTRKGWKRCYKHKWEIFEKRVTRFLSDRHCQIELMSSFRKHALTFQVLTHGQFCNEIIHHAKMILVKQTEIRKESYA